MPALDWWLSSATKITVLKDIYTDPALFINGKTKQTIDTFPIDHIPMLTEVEVSVGDPIFSYIEDMYLFEQELSVSPSDAPKAEFLRMRGSETGRIYMFTNVKAFINKFSPFVPKATTSNVSSKFAECTSTTLGIIILDKNFTILDPLMILGKGGAKTLATLFNFPTQTENKNTQVTLNTESKVVESMTVGYFIVKEGGWFDDPRIDTDKHNVDLLKNLAMPPAGVYITTNDTVVTSGVIVKPTRQNNQTTTQIIPSGDQEARERVAKRKGK